MLKTKKGFTLVELLAVIVILAVILAIAIPGISNMTKNAKKSSFEDNVKLIIKGIDYAILNADLAGTARPAVSASNNIKDSLGDYGANPNDYASFYITSLNPITISITGSGSNSKFGSCTVTGATMSNIKHTGPADQPGVISGC
ncbi:MAG TPA: type II secretion system protein [Mollicutes bacterium]|nr:type II secretion system protein [Mollicutes bacterium]